jgi:type IV secretion system protein VirD4
VRPHSDRTDTLLLVGVALGFGAGLVVWLTGEMAGLFWRGRWPAVSPAAVGSILARLPSTFGKPAYAWPPAARTELPSGVGWYLAGGAVSLAALLGVARVILAATRFVKGSVLGGPEGSLAARPPLGPRRGRSSAGPGRMAAFAGRSQGLPRGRSSGGSAHGLGRRGFGNGHRGMTPRPGGAPRGPSTAGWGGNVRHAGGIAGHRWVGGAHWARRRDVGSLLVPSSGGGRLILGRVGRSLIATEARHSVLVLGPTQSGKTTALAIPALLEWDGPVVATSVKDDLVAHTSGYRANLGRLWIYDPTGTGRGGLRSRWSPLTEASTWSGAQRVAQDLVGAAPSQSGLSDGAFWFSASAKLLAPLLLAAERGGRPIAQVVRWTNLQETEEVRWLLEMAGETEAIEALVAGLSRDERIRSSIYTTLETVLAPYEDPIVAESAACSDIDPVALLNGRNTLYLCGPAHEQARVQGVFSALVGAIVHAAITRYERLGPLDPPLLVVLDEAANIAPLQELDKLASTGAGMGIQLVTVCQDLAQLSTRYGPDRARSIANNHRAKVALSGIADVGTLDTVSALAGEQAVREQTITSDRKDGRHSATSSVAYRRLAPADEVRRIPPGAGLLIYGHLPPARLVLRPWYRDAELRRRVSALPPPDPC